MALSIPIFLNSEGAEGTPTNFTQNFGSPIYLNPNNQYLVYLKKFTYYNSIKNITAEQQNNQLKYYNSFDWATFTFEDGAYNIDDLNRTLYEYFETINELYDVEGEQTSPIYFEALNSTDKIKINLKAGWRVDFTVGMLCDRLGFYNTDVITTTRTGGKAANITDQDSIMVHCSITSDSIFNGNKTDVIENVPIKVPPNYQQVYEPLHLTYSLVNTSVIYGLQMRLTDQVGKEIKLDDNVTYDMSIIQASRVM